MNIYWDKFRSDRSELLEGDSITAGAADTILAHKQFLALLSNELGNFAFRLREYHDQTGAEWCEGVCRKIAEFIKAQK